MEQLLEDYKRRLVTVLEMINNATIIGGFTYSRLKTKASCYRTFISELEREINNLKTIS